MENDRKEAIHAIALMIERSEKAQTKFLQGTSQYSLLENRINALTIALTLLEKDLNMNYKVIEYSKVDLEKAIAPIKSLISKSEKAQEKLAQGTWQHKMLENNLRALNIVLPILNNVLNDMG